MKQGRKDDPRKPPKDGIGFISPYRAKLKKDLKDFDNKFTAGGVTVGDYALAKRSNNKLSAIRSKVASNKAARDIESNNRSIKPDNTRVNPRKP